MTASETMTTPAGLARAVAFFHEHAPYCWDPARETEADGRLRTARRLAAAEAWLEATESERDWREEETAAGDDEGTWVVIYSCTVRTPHGDASMGGIDLDPDGFAGDTYRRVVEAQLALEIMPE